jgi:putative membrane protein
MTNPDKLRTALANERTLLAYIRTALSAWIFGMAAVKFFPENVLIVSFGWVVSISGTLILFLGFYYSKKRHNSIHHTTN